MGDEQDWDESDSDEGTCDHCGKTKRCTLTVDPYIREIWPDEENNQTWWCHDCYSDRAADI
jgi:hypothetical protein